MSRYLVTGATGFLGTHLSARLREQGHDVVALCRDRVDGSLPSRSVDDADKPSGASASARLRELGATLRRGDVLDAGSVRDAAAGCDGVFHCAGRVSRKAEDAEALYRIHVDGTKVTLDACAAAGVPRAVIASTSGVVAVSKGPDEVRDETAPPPMELLAGWPYYRSKLYAERAAFDRNRGGFAVVSVNPSLLLGPGDERGSSTGDVARFLERKVPIVPAGGLSFVDARDAAEAMILAMDKGRAGERYLLGAANMTLDAFMSRLERLSGVQAPRLRAPRSVTLARAGAQLMERAARRMHREPLVDRISAEMGQHFWYVDSTRARTELGWSARDPNETLADTIEDLRARGVVWPTG